MVECDLAKVEVAGSNPVSRLSNQEIAGAALSPAILILGAEGSSAANE